MQIMVVGIVKPIFSNCKFVDDDDPGTAVMVIAMGKIMMLRIKDTQ